MIKEKNEMSLKFYVFPFRAACNLKLQGYDEALENCQEVSTQSKFWFRKLIEMEVIGSSNKWDTIGYIGIFGYTRIKDSVNKTNVVCLWSLVK